MVPGLQYVRRLTETRHSYFSDQWQIVREMVSGSTAALYIWGLRYIDELLVRYDPTFGRQYAMQDANFNCTAICDDALSSGTVDERYQYDPYAGNRIILDGSWNVISSSTYNWTVGHQGLMFDAEVGIYNCRNRVYLPILGVWMQRDPLGYADGFLQYLYCYNAPITHRDPSGALLDLPPVAPLFDPVPPWVITTPSLFPSVLPPGVEQYRVYKLPFDAPPSLPPDVGVGAAAAEGCCEVVVEEGGGILAACCTSGAAIGAACGILANLIWTQTAGEGPRTEQQEIGFLSPRKPAKSIRTRNPEEEECHDRYVRCLHTRLADFGHGNRCGECRDLCNARGYWPMKLNGGAGRCDYWNVAQTQNIVPPDWED